MRSQEAHEWGELQFRLPDCTPWLVEAVRAELRVFSAIEDVVHRGCDIVSVIYEGAPQVSDWVARLDECGIRLEILIDEDLTAGAA